MKEILEGLVKNNVTHRCYVNTGTHVFFGHLVFGTVSGTFGLSVKNDPFVYLNFASSNVKKIESIDHIYIIELRTLL